MDEALQQRHTLSQQMQSAYFSARVWDAKGDLTVQRAQEALTLFQEFGALHIIRTGLQNTQSLLPLMEAIGFGPAAQFSFGGRTSASVQQKWVAQGLRRMDHYPPSLYLLPNNEVQYQHCGPQRVLFFCQQPAITGGRTFLHSAHAVEAHIRSAGALGERFLERLSAHGLMIETGFLDQNHPSKSDNYFQSWQERFGSPDPDMAMINARQKTSEYDCCWWKTEDSGHRTLMTRIVLSAFKSDERDGRRYLRFPRLALGEPSLQNGHRRYPLGNGEPFSAAERALLLEAYLRTREGIHWSVGDIVLFDNVRFGHSRECFTGPRAVFVGMAGEVWDDAVAKEKVQALPTQLPAPPMRGARSAQARHHYTLPSMSSMLGTNHSCRIFDARGVLDVEMAKQVVSAFEQHGAVHVVNTGIRCSQPSMLSDEVLDWLGFGPAVRFAWGGFNSGRTQRRALGRNFRATDDYPPQLWLLPHNEILYQRTMPRRLLFFSAHDIDVECGGRTLVHCADRLEDYLRRAPGGRALLQRLDRHGLLIESGFLDENHPRKAENYFRSWQDRFETTSRVEAMRRCQGATDQFDSCWWHQEEGISPSGEPLYTLMTRIRMPAFQTHPDTGRRHLFFPRIALDAPALHNGHRRFPLGDNTNLLPDEIDLLLEGFLRSREGVHWSAGDILLVDNIRYGHSREPYLGARELGVAMAGCFGVDS